MRMIIALAALLIPAAAASAACIAESSDITIKGTISVSHRRAKGTGMPFVYYSLRTPQAYCLSDTDNSVNQHPTREITLTATDLSSLDKFSGKAVSVEGQLSGSDGGPLLYAEHVTLQ